MSAFSQAVNYEEHIPFSLHIQSLEVEELLDVWEETQLMECAMVAHAVPFSERPPYEAILVLELQNRALRTPIKQPLLSPRPWAFSLF